MVVSDTFTSPKYSWSLSVESGTLASSPTPMVKFRLSANRADVGIDLMFNVGLPVLSLSSLLQADNKTAASAIIIYLIDFISLLFICYVNVTTCMKPLHRQVSEWKNDACCRLQ